MEGMREPEKMTTLEAVRGLRADPQSAAMLRDAYRGEDVCEAAERFRASAEFTEVCGQLDGGKILDLGAGTGIASYALARSGARVVNATLPPVVSILSLR